MPDDYRGRDLLVHGIAAAKGTHGASQIVVVGQSGEVSGDVPRKGLLEWLARFWPTGGTR
jgi:hypothetical protein